MKTRAYFAQNFVFSIFCTTLNEHNIFFKGKFFIYVTVFYFSLGAAQHVMDDYSKIKSHNFMYHFCDIL